MTEKTLIKKLTDASFSKETASGIILVDFYAEWCGPCRMMSPILEQVASELQGEAVIAKLDIDSEQKTAGQFRVTSVPTLVLFKNGKEVNRLIGLRDADDIKEFIKSAK